MKHRILIIEDEPAISDNIQFVLQSEGLETIRVATGLAASPILDEDIVDLIILDIGLPDINGIDLLKEIRRTRATPVILLTARTAEIDRVLGLEIGADDYVAKPFSPRELSARIKAILRRVEQRSDDEVLSARDIVLRRDSRDVTVSGGEIELTSKEFDLLACFLEHPGIVLSREKLLDLVWGMTYPGGTRTVDVHVAQLRRKLGDPETIRTVRGAGYKLTAVG